MSLVSSNNASLVVSVEGYAPIVVENFDADSDIWSVNDRQTADGELSPDGVFNYWSINAPIEATLNLSGGSDSAEALQAILNSQTRQGAVNSQVGKCSVIITLNGVTETYSEGVMTTGASGRKLGNQKLLSLAFNFKFGKYTRG